MQEQELFNNYEVKNWNFSPRIYKILAASAIFNILALVIVGQSNLLTMKGCDSPLVNKVCGVLDALYVGGTVLTTDVSSEEGPWNPERIQDEDVVWVNVADKLTYPEGYFALSNPEMYAQQTVDDTMGFNPTTGTNGFPGITTNPTTGDTSDMLGKQPELPKQKPNVIDGTLPKSTDNPTVAKTNPYKPYKVKTPKQKTITDKSPDTLPKLTPDTTADKNGKTEDKTKDEQTTDAQKTPSSDKVAGIEINKKPLQDLANNIIANKDFDINKPFSISMNGVLTKDGKLDKKLSKFDTTKESGDEAMRNIARLAIERLGESGWLGYLSELKVEKINFTVTQDGEKLTVVVTSDQPNESRAKTVASGLNNAISIGKMTTKGEDERKLLESAKVTQNGKTFVLNFSIPKEVAAEMINRKLEEERQKLEAEKSKSNSTGKVLNKTQNAGK